MVGLGAGACTVALLSNFPDLDLTVVEIDPKVVELASQYFPLVGHYQDEGRLTIVTHDATEYLLQALMDEDQWDFGILDAYSGSNDPHVPHELLTLAAETCQAIWLNVIDRPQGATVRHVQEVLTVAEKPIQFVAAANQPAFLGVTNLTLATQSPESETARKFIPYRDMSGLGVDTARRHYQVVAEQAS